MTVSLSDRNYPAALLGLAVLVGLGAFMFVLVAGLGGANAPWGSIRGEVLRTWIIWFAVVSVPPLTLLWLLNIWAVAVVLGLAIVSRVVSGVEYASLERNVASEFLFALEYALVAAVALHLLFRAGLRVLADIPSNLTFWKRWFFWVAAFLAVTLPMALAQSARPLTTPLHEAASAGDLKAVTAIIDSGFDVNTDNLGGFTALHEASMRQNSDIVRELLEAGAAANFPTDRVASTPLHLAANSSDNPEIIRILVEFGGDLNAQNRYGETPMHVAADDANSAEIVGELIAVGSNINSRDNRGDTPLHNAADPNGRSNADETEVVVLLLEAGAAVNALSDDGETPLHKAAHAHTPNIELVNALLEAGADSRATSNEGDTPCDIATSKRPRPLVAKAVCEAASTQ